MLSVLEIGEKIAIARKMKNLSQAQLAMLLNISPQAVGKWERGESMPDIVTFGQLAEVLGVDLNYFGSQEMPISVATVTQSVDAASNQVQGWNMSGGNWVDADFSGLRGLAEKFSGANIERCKFIKSELSGLTLKGNNIENSDFSHSNLKECKFAFANLQNNIFVGCNFAGSFLSRNNIQNCDFSAANLTNVVFKGDNIKKTKLDGAILNGTAFRYGQLTEIIFSTEIKNCSFENCDFLRVEFNGTTICNSFFKNCKLKRVKFTACKADKLSFAFMKSCKADLSDVQIIEEN